MVFAALGGACFYAIWARDERRAIACCCCVGAALFCQLRLLANMMDGMVAVEAGKGGPDGPVWNELPDRFADIFILVGAGYGVAAAWASSDARLGWAAAVAAVMTAYVREVVRAAGAPADFSGPMAKPHRMFVMTVAALAAAAVPLWADDFALPGVAAMPTAIVTSALWIVVIGATSPRSTERGAGLRSSLAQMNALRPHACLFFPERVQAHDQAVGLGAGAASCAACACAAGWPHVDRPKPCALRPS